MITKQRTEKKNQTHSEENDNETADREEKSNTLGGKGSGKKPGDEVSSVDLGGGKRLVTKVAKKDSSPNIFLKNEDVLKMYKQSWLEVSTKQLTNSGFYPDVVLPNGDKIWNKITKGTIKETETREVTTTQQ